MGHGEDPSPREQTERTPERDTGEGENRDPNNTVCLIIYVGVCCDLTCALQVNSKGYKVCGEASSVCGTITINKRKVQSLFL